MVGIMSTQEVTLTNTGTRDVVLTQERVTGAQFSTAGIGSNLTLSPGQVAVLSVNFRPTAAGSATGSVVLASNASVSQAVIQIQGVGIVAQHFVALRWQASDETEPRYRVYRRGSSNDAWEKLTDPPLKVTYYTDTAVESGQTYSYAVALVNSSESESNLSAAISVSIP